MTNYTEMELKLRFVDLESWEKILDAAVVKEWGNLVSYRRELLETHYFDTSEQRLRQARMAYRVRFEDGGWVAVVKSGGMSCGGLHQRQEWSVSVVDSTPNIASFLPMPVGAVLQDIIKDEQLLEICTTNFERKSILLNTPDGSCVELVADRGEIRVGDRKTPILELELELKSGASSNLLKLGAMLSREFPLLPEWRSKYFRALQLVNLTGEPATQKINPPVWHREDSMGFVLPQIAIHIIQSIIAAQESFLASPGDSRTLKQLHQQLCKLRTLLTFSRQLLSEELYQEYQDALYQWDLNLGEIRKINVVWENWEKVVATDTTSFTVAAVWRNKLEARQVSMIADLQTKLAQGETTPLLLDIWTWAEKAASGGCSASKYIDKN